MSHIAVIGSGLIGRAWVISFARSGRQVKWWSPTAGRTHEALAYIDQMLPDLAANDLLRGSSLDEVRGRIELVGSMEDAVVGCVHVQECALEDINTKRELFSRLDAIAPVGAVLASSTSAIQPSTFTEHLKGRSRCVVAHPLNPPYLMPAVEVVPSRWTSPEIVEITVELMRSIGQSPIVQHQEDLGFVTIRLQGALLQEAFRIVEEGLASPSDVDRAIKDGLAIRWSVIGPFETIDLNAPSGVRDYVKRYQKLYAGLAQEHCQVTDWSGPVLETIEKERRSVLPLADLAARQIWRDRRLMSLAKQRRQASLEFGD